MHQIKPTKEQFLEYEEIRKSGITNMYATNIIRTISETGLDTERCLYIYDHYDELMEEYVYGKCESGKKV